MRSRRPQSQRASPDHARLPKKGVNRRHLGPRMPQGGHLHLLVGVGGGPDELDNLVVERRRELLAPPPLGGLCHAGRGRQGRNPLDNLPRKLGRALHNLLVVLCLLLGGGREGLGGAVGVQVLPQQHVQVMLELPRRVGERHGGSGDGGGEPPLQPDGGDDGGEHARHAEGHETRHVAEARVHPDARGGACESDVALSDREEEAVGGGGGDLERVRRKDRARVLGGKVLAEGPQLVVCRRFGSDVVEKDCVGNEVCYLVHRTHQGVWRVARRELLRLCVVVYGDSIWGLTNAREE
mmetsp:Transcript_6606/g.16031  ORF Transcript_6606/g.16031 Transcript_6606/m.16031 type:complete len:295 (+) Transcript_6606:134-1018(+)